MNAEAALARRPVWISENDVADTLTMPGAIEAVRAGLRDLGAGAARTMVKTHVAWPTGGPAPATLHAIGGAMPGEQVAGTKTWVHTPRGSSPVVLLFGSDTGRLLAVLEAFTLGQLRTGAVSGLATDLLAAPDADSLCMVGTGRQALAQVAAVAAVRPLRLVRVAGRDQQRAQALADLVEEVVGVRSEAGTDPRAAAAASAVVTLATRATAPILHAADLGGSAHLNAIGAITPERREFAPELLARCRVLCVDSVAQARTLSAELRDALGSGDGGWEQVVELSALVAGTAQGGSGEGPTFFKSLGIGLADVAIAVHCWRQAVAAGRGTPLPERPDEPAMLLRPFRTAAGGVA